MSVKYDAKCHTENDVRRQVGDSWRQEESVLWGGCGQRVEVSESGLTINGGISSSNLVRELERMIQARARQTFEEAHRPATETGRARYTSIKVRK